MYYYKNFLFYFNVSDGNFKCFGSFSVEMKVRRTSTCRMNIELEPASRDVRETVREKNSPPDFIGIRNERVANCPKIL